MASQSSILTETGTNEMELLAVTIEGQLFGINVAKVQAIIQFDTNDVTRLPGVEGAMMGMIIYRERTVPLIHLGRALGKSGDASELRQVVVLTEFNNSVTGFKVDGVQRIHRVSWESFVPASPIFNPATTHVTGSVTIEDDDILVLDMEQLLTQYCPDLAFEDLSEALIEAPVCQKRNELTIYFAEDSGLIRSHVVKALKRAGIIHLKDFPNGRDAFEALSLVTGDTDERPDLLITDIEMPQMDGLTLCRNIKSDPELADMKVIMFSSLINEQMIAKCNRVGADAYVTKPELNRLVSLIDSVMAA